MICLVIPAYNEALNLPELLSSLSRWSERRGEQSYIIAVDDGSQDETADILKSFRDLPLTIVRHEVNRGVHQAFRSAFLAWSERAPHIDDVVVTLEADNTSSLDILDQMIARVRGGDDIVLASCYAPGGTVVKTNLLRVILSFGANLILRSTPGMPSVKTFSSFYRCYAGSFLDYCMRAYGGNLIEKEGFVCVAEMLLKFHALDARISEVPLCLDGDRRKGPSKMKVLRTIRGYLQLFWDSTTGRLARPSAVEITAEAALDKGASGST